ncbi:MAG TPA: prepilin-type N-terminal cleavage/methylation domain-containing protein [Gemmatimonadales bacterium]|nr:prepilin-type N-terminal cleavage/methylation domain-containing protein [Gemmatimonadales bacterium]
MAVERRRERGLTLIELVVAMSIVMLLVTMTVVSADALTGQKAKSAAGELAGTIRSLYDTASLTGKTCRLVFQLPNESAEDGAVKVSAECAQGAVTTSRDREEVLRQARLESDAAAKESDRDRSRRDEEERDRQRRQGDDEKNLQDLMAEEKDRVEAAARFQGFEDQQVKPKALPSSVRVSVWTRHQKEPARSGIAYLYFFPQGYTEQAQVVVRQGSNAWTITVAPLTGKTSVVDKELEAPSR